MKDSRPVSERPIIMAAAMRHTTTLLAGDGIGHRVTRAARRIIDAAGRRGVRAGL